MDKAYFPTVVRNTIFHFTMSFEFPLVNCEAGTVHLKNKNHEFK